MIKIQKQIKEYSIQYSYILQLLKIAVNLVLAN